MLRALRASRMASMAMMAIRTSIAGEMKSCTCGTPNMMKIMNSAAGMNNPSRLRRESTMSRTYALTGPLSRGSR